MVTLEEEDEWSDPRIDIICYHTHPVDRQFLPIVPETCTIIILQQPEIYSHRLRRAIIQVIRTGK